MKQNRLQTSFSIERLKSYEILCPSGLEKEIIGAYHWNLLICQALYPFLHSAEIALRNGIHQAIIDKYNNENWFNFVVKGNKSIQMLGDIRKELNRKSYSKVDDTVAALTFGFWVNLLKQKIYRDQFNEHRLWPDLIPLVFPRYDRSAGGDDRKQISQRFEEIKLLRNRLFHHEPIWKFKKATTANESVTELRKKFNDIYKAIGWMSKSKQEYLKQYGFVDFFKQNCTTEVLDEFKSKLLDTM
jgi:hypothetical protein